MTPDQIQSLNQLVEFMNEMKSANMLPLQVDQALTGRGFVKSLFGAYLGVAQGGTGAATLTGILKGNGTSPITAIVPLSGTRTYYVSDLSGGAVTRKLTFTNGILTAET